MPDLKNWRFIDTGTNNGAYNMALDEMLLNDFSGTPVFRLYGWSPSAISLGRFQKASEILNTDICSKHKISAVQRITGGGAIFHGEELTYSLVCPWSFFGKLSVKESYRKLCAFLILSYKKLGLNASFSGRNNCSQDFSHFCFAGREEYDILIESRKIGGNAQRRKRNIIFQHGSIPIKLDIKDIQKFFSISLDDVENNTVCLETLKPDISMQELKNIIKTSFEESLGITLTEDSLSDREEEALRDLLNHKHKKETPNEDFTCRLAR